MKILDEQIIYQATDEQILGELHDRLVRIVGLSGKDGGALGAETGRKGGILLVGTADDSTIL